MSSHDKWQMQHWEDAEGYNWAYGSDPELFMQMLEHLNNPARTQQQALEEAVHYTTNLVLENPRIRLLVEEMTARSNGRPPLMDSTGEDAQYWTTTTLLLQTVLGKVIGSLFFPSDGETMILENEEPF